MYLKRKAKRGGETLDLSTWVRGSVTWRCHEWPNLFWQLGVFTVTNIHAGTYLYVHNSLAGAEQIICIEKVDNLNCL